MPEKEPRKRAPGAGRKPRAGVEATESVRIAVTPAELARIDADRGPLPRSEHIRRKVLEVPGGD